MRVLIAMAAVMFGLNADPDPLTAYFNWSRGELKAAGLERKATDDGSVYWTGGHADGKTLVLLHGVNDQAGTWSPVAKELAKDYHLIIPDLAGHGESEPKSGPITFAAMLDKLKAVLQREKAANVTLAGNSMGGWVAMLYALDHPRNVERLVLEDASGLAWDMTGVPLVPKNREEADKMMRAVHGPDTKTPDNVLDALLNRKDAPLSRIGFPDVVAHLVDPRLKDLKLPVTIIWGRDDGILSLTYAKSLHDRISGSTLSIIDGAAHIPHRQQPAKFIQCLKATC